MMCSVQVFKVCRLNQHLLRSKCQGVMLKQDLNDVLPDHCFPNNGGNQSPDNHHNTLSWNGKEEGEEGRVNLRKWNKKNPIRWPWMSDQVKWNTLANSFYLQLPAYGPITKKIRQLETILMTQFLYIVWCINQRKIH